MPNHDEKKAAKTLDVRAADHILQNVFLECEQQPNKIPFEKFFTLKQSFCVGYKVAQGILIAMLLLLLCFPLSLAEPNAKTQLQTTQDILSASYHVQITSLLPVKSISAKLNNEPVDIIKNGGKDYNVVVKKNGMLTVSITLMNNLQKDFNTLVNHLDKTKPTIEKHYREQDQIHVFVADKETGVDYNNIYAVDLEGNQMKPASYHEDTGEIVFDYPTETINIFVPDRQGNVLQAVITPKAQD